MDGISSSSAIFRDVVLLLLLLVSQNVKVMVASSSTITMNNVGVVGIIVDNTSRAGKEARVAAEMAINDFNAKMGHDVNFYTRISQVAEEAANLIDAHQVEAILGQQTLEEVFSVAEVGTQAKIPTFALLDLIPEWALDQWPFLVQASPSQLSQMRAVTAILESWGWNCLTFMYEDVNSASAQVITHLMDAIRDGGVEMSKLVELSPWASSSLLLKELERLKKEQCRVFVVHTSLETSTRLFQEAQRLEMMVKGYVWITTNLITDLIHSVNASTISMMQGVLGLGSFFPDTGSRFDDFSTRFQKKFKMEQPEEETKIPGIFAVQAYDATWAVALALSGKNMSGQKLLDKIHVTTFDGLTGEVQFIDRKLTPSHKFQITNVMGRSYRQLGFWSEGLGFSEVLDATAVYGSSMQTLGQVFWPGAPLSTPRGWALPTSQKPWRVGVPTQAMFKQFVKVEYDQREHNFSYTGFSIELFKETVKRLPYPLPYEFYPFNGTYDSLVEQVYLKKFDAVVGDVSVVSRRYQYAEFTQPYTEKGLVMVVPIESHHEPFLFVKPFTVTMWVLTIMVSLYNGFVVWLIERHHSPELQGSVLNQAGILLNLAFMRIFSTNGDQLHSKLTRMATVVWLFVALIISQSYTASLTSMLTVRRLIPKVADFETLKRENAVVGCSKGAHVITYLEDVLGFHANNIRSFTAPEQYARALRGGEIAAVFLEAPFTKLFLGKYCNSFIVAGPTFEEGGFAFVLPKHSPMLSDITEALLNVSESGTLRDLEDRMIGSEKCVDSSSLDEYDSLGLDSFLSLFLLTICTSTIALAIYAIVSLCNLCKTRKTSVVAIISGVADQAVCRWRRLSRKVSDIESPNTPPNTQELTQV